MKSQFASSDWGTTNNLTNNNSAQDVHAKLALASNEIASALDVNNKAGGAKRKPAAKKPAAKKPAAKKPAAKKPAAKKPAAKKPAAKKPAAKK